MSAQVKIDQATLAPAGTAGKSRTDGKSGGQLVTLTNTGLGTTTRFRLLWVPPGDTTAVASLVQTGPKVWTFSPTASQPGTYRIQLIEDEGRPSERREVRTFKVRTPIFGLTIPALNEVGDASASMVNAGAAQIEAAEDNADDYTIASLNTRRFAAWWRWVHELTLALEATFVRATGSANGFASRTVYDFSTAPTFTTAADIPPGNFFLCILRGPSGGSGAGARGANTNVLGGAASGGGACHRWLMTRQQFIAMLPVVLTLPDGGAGGTLAAGVGSANGGSGVAASGGALFSGTGFKGFAGSGAPGTGGGVAGNGGGGGGLWGNGNVLASGNGGRPASTGASSGGGGSSTEHDNYSFGGGFGVQNSGGAGAGLAGNATDGGGGGGGDPNSGGIVTAGGSSLRGSAGGGSGGTTAAAAASNGGDGGSTGNSATGLAVGGGGLGGLIAGPKNGTPGVDATDTVGATGSGGGASARGAGAQAAGDGAAGAAGGGGAGGGGAVTSTNGGNMTPGQGNKGGKATFTLIGLP
jgi:hypothetical protein